VLYSVRSERQLMEQLDYNLLFRWFVGLELDDEVWDVTVFTKNRERLIGGEVSQELLAAVLAEAQEKQLLSAEHFSVDGTLIQAWAASRSFQEKSDPPASGQGSGHGGEVLLRDKVESKTDREARLYKKATADKSVPSYQGHALLENRNGLVVAAQASCSATAAEREAALEMLDEVVKRPAPGGSESGVTLGADTQYQDEKFIAGLRQRGVAPHVSEYTKGSEYGQERVERAGTGRPAPLDQSAQAQADRGGIRVGETGSSVATDQAAGIEAGGLVLSAGGDGVQPDAAGEADSDSGAGRIGLRCLGRLCKGLQRSKGGCKTSQFAPKRPSRSRPENRKAKNKGFFRSL